MSTQLNHTDIIILNAVFAKMDKTAFALASGLVFFLGMFIVTAILILKGATPTTVIGPNLQSLSFYLPGYSLTWMGNIIGSMYVGVVGLFIGLFFAYLWNLVHYIYLALMINRLNFYDDI